MFMIIAVPLVLSSVSAGAPAAATDPFAAASNQFAFDLWKKLSSGGNLAISPASMALALCMTGSGAKGDTELEMRKALHWSEPLERCLPLAGRLCASLADPARKVTFRIANRLFGDNALVIEKAYQQAVSKELQAPVERVDFQKEFEKARARINAWVEEQTEKRISDLVPAGGVNALTRLVLVNALYFLGDWETPSMRLSPARSRFISARARPVMYLPCTRPSTCAFIQETGFRRWSYPTRAMPTPCSCCSRTKWTDCRSWNRSSMPPGSLPSSAT